MTILTGVCGVFLDETLPGWTLALRVVANVEVGHSAELVDDSAALLTRGCVRLFQEKRRMMAAEGARERGTEERVQSCCSPQQAGYTIHHHVMAMRVAR